MIYRIDTSELASADELFQQEWLLTDGKGGYAMGSVAGACTRRYHGLLISALRPPVGRTVLLKAIDAFVETEAGPVGISCNVYPGVVYPEGQWTIEAFEVDRTARWFHRVGEMAIEREVELLQGGIAVRYRNASTQSVRLIIHPLVVSRDHHAEQSSGDLNWEATLTIECEGWEKRDDPVWYHDFVHSRESERGLPDRESAFRPFELSRTLAPGETVEIKALAVLAPASGFSWADTGDENPFREATRAFVVQGGDRTTILAGYPWFNDWGRDTMISLPGTLLANGRFEEARETILGYARRMRHGLIPNRFLDDGEGADYNTVDATLWMFEATRRTLFAQRDEAFAREMALHLRNSADAHRAGTEFGIGIDRDGLLEQGGTGLQLTWMDAKIGEWVVTPRTGKPIEINALWINALDVLARLPDPPSWVDGLLRTARASFQKFWREDLGWYADVLDPESKQLRPNQVIALSLRSVPVEADQALRALEAVESHLLTPKGLRTLAPFEWGYRGRFDGTMADRDSAYHQGTVWPWLLGPYASALTRFGRLDEARRVLRSAEAMLTDCGLGGISEVYDGDAPHRPAGCPWQAWSVAEPSRAWEDLARMEREKA
ncbi:glycogen debranching protein [bacterium]|nr:MAG: glycogen debranching protein [bacterium]